MAKGIESNGVTLSVSAGSPTAFLAVGNITAIRGTGAGADVVNITNVEDTEPRKLMGLPDEGAMTVDLNYDPDNATHIILRNARKNRTRLEFKIRLTDECHTLLFFFGYVVAFSIDSATSQQVKGSMTIEISGGAWDSIEPPPIAPYGVSAAATSPPPEITVSWSPVSCADSYDIYWATSAGVTPSTGTRIAGVTSPYVFSNVLYGVTYYFIVVAVNEGGISDQSSEVNAGLYITFDPAAKNDHVVLSNGNLTATGDNSSNNRFSVLGTGYAATGKRYFEAAIASGVGADWVVGITKSTFVFGASDMVGTPSGNGIGYKEDARKFIEGTGSAYGATYGNGDVIGVLYDSAAGTLTFWKNGVSQGVAASGLSGSYTPAVSVFKDVSITGNFGATQWAYAPPEGYIGWTV